MMIAAIETIQSLNAKWLALCSLVDSGRDLHFFRAGKIVPSQLYVHKVVVILNTMHHNNALRHLCNRHKGVKKKVILYEYLLILLFDYPPRIKFRIRK